MRWPLVLVALLCLSIDSPAAELVYSSKYGGQVQPQYHRAKCEALYGICRAIPIESVGDLTPCGICKPPIAAKATQYVDPSMAHRERSQAQSAEADRIETEKAAAAAAAEAAKADAAAKAKPVEQDSYSSGGFSPVSATYSTGSSSSKSEWVSGYTKKNGTRVSGYYRRSRSR